MKHLCHLICILLLAGSAAAQTKTKTLELGNMVSDPASVNQDLGARFGLSTLEASAATIEIRMYSQLGFPGAQCVVLQYDKGWKAFRYKLNAKDSVVRSTLRPAAGVESIARSVIAFNILSLPSQKALNSGNYRLDLATGEVKPASISLADAPCYTVQFKAGTASREYKYCDPKSYGAFYKGQHEYADMVNILKAFARLEAR